MSSRSSDSATRPAPFFDQGLFLLHLNRGKEEMRRGTYDEARREFEAAQRFRPNDPEVLSNLSFALFHLGHYEDAERMTRDLLKKYPDSVPLLFNLGLILFKGGRDAEAKAPLLKILDIAPSHRKAHLTLGLVLQRIGETTRALKHFKLAGAELRAGSEGDDTVARTARAASQELPSGAVRHPSATTVKPETVEGLEERTMPRLVSDLPLAPAAVASSAATSPITVPIVAIGPFLPKGGGFLSADCRSGLLVRRDILTGRSGAPTLEGDRQLTGALARLLVRAGGNGTLLLVDRGRRPYLRSLEEEFLSVDPGRLFAFQSSLVYREDPAFEFRRHIALPFLKLFGTGAVAFSVFSEPERFVVTPADPLTLSARAVLAYGGDVRPELLEETDPLAEFGSGPVFRFVGSGFVLAEAG